MTDSNGDSSLIELPDGENPRSDSRKDYAKEKTEERSFFLNLWFLGYKTPDTIQGAAVLLTVLLLIILTMLTLIGLINENKDIMDVVSWLTYPLMATIGVAIGRNIPKSPD